MKKAAFVVALALIAGSAMARSADIYEPPVVIVNTEEASTIQMRGSIVDAAQSLGWVVSKDEPGQLELHFDKQGKHQVNIAVAYDAKSYKISYLTSSNLNFSDDNGLKKIHPNYNRWIKNLMKRIQER